MKLKVRLGIAIGVTIVIFLVFLLGKAIANSAHDPVTGVVERVGSVAETKNVSIKLKENSTLYTCDERCYAMLVGDTVTLYFAPISSTEINRATIDQTTLGRVAQ